MRTRRLTIDAAFWGLLVVASSLFHMASAHQPGLPDTPKPKSTGPKAKVVLEILTSGGE